MHEIWISHSLVVSPTILSDLNQHAPKHIVWLKPNFGEAKVNIDGSRTGNPPVAGFSGLFEDRSGAWLGGYSSRLGDHSVPFFELQSIKHGLNLAWSKGFRRV